MSDLTRWNRAGLSRFRYVDGNAITYLERLRKALAEAYTPEGEALPSWSDLVTRLPEAADETRAERQARLIAQYEDARRDHAWEILRSFARSTHVLTEHIDAYANETFIGTATQWDSLRRLIQLLDARPAPPASARTDLAFAAEEVGILTKGFQFKNAPTDGSPPAIFETIDDLELDPALNQLHPTAWNRSQIDFSYSDNGDEHRGLFPVAASDTPPLVGEIAVLEFAAGDGVSNSTAYGVQVSQMLGDNAVLLGQQATSDLSVKRWRVSLHTEAELVQTPRLAGPDVVILTDEHNLSAGRSSITWFASSTWRTGKVMEVDGNRVRLSASSYPPVGTAIYLMAEAKTQVVGGSSRVILPIERGASGTIWSEEFSDISGTIQSQKDLDDDGNEFIVYQYTAMVDVLLYLPGAASPVAHVEQSAPTQLVLGGKVEDLRQGDWIVSAGANLQAVRVDSVTDQDGDTAIDTTPAISDLQSPIHLKFARTLRPDDHDRNRTAAFADTARSDHVTRLFVDPDPWPDLLARGRRIIVETDGLSHCAEISAVDESAGWIEVSPTFPGTELTDPQIAPPLERWNTVIHGNVVTADHGETQPLKILGSGDATQSGQAFEHTASELAFVTDPLMPTGVRAAIDIFVGEHRWEQVANLRDSAQTDPHFEIRVTEDGPVNVMFGDGRHGRRLPTGTDNVRIVWRKGVGPSGNLVAGSLLKPVQPSPLVDSVAQPIASAGGAKAETVASLRENAASGLLTLGRAVSVSDYGKLAGQNAQVLQALSYLDTAGSARGETITVVVVPAGGRMGTLGDDLKAFLTAHALPGVNINVIGYVPLPLGLDVTLRIDQAIYDPDKVADAARTAIQNSYALEKAGLGRTLFRSQILHLLESVEGVENATATLLTSGWAAITPPPLINTSEAGSVRSVEPRKTQMIHYDADLSNITIRTEDFSL